MQRTLVAAVLALGVSGCAPPEPVVPVPMPPEPPPAPEPRPEPFEPEQACDEAETTLRSLDCRKPDGTPWYTTPQGTPFGEACYRAFTDGRDWHPECIAAIDDCEQLQAAYRGERCP